MMRTIITKQHNYRLQAVLDSARHVIRTDIRIKEESNGRTDEMYRLVPVGDAASLFPVSNVLFR